MGAQVGPFQADGLHLAGGQHGPLAAENAGIAQIYGDLFVLEHTAHAEADGHGIAGAGRAHRGGHGVAHAVLAMYRDGRGVLLAILQISGGLGTGSAGFLGNIVHQIMHMQHIACGKHAGDAGLQAFVDQRPAGDGA